MGYLTYIFKNVGYDWGNFAATKKYNKRETAGQGKKGVEFP